MAFEEFSGPDAIDDYISDTYYETPDVPDGVYTKEELEFIRHVIRDYDYGSELTDEDKKKHLGYDAEKWVEAILHGYVGQYFTKKEQLDMTCQVENSDKYYTRYFNTDTYALLDERAPHLEKIPF